MITITVILAAVIGTFVLGLGNQVSDSAPQASVAFEFDETVTGTSCSSIGSESTSGELVITHDGGGKLQAGNIDIADNDGNSQ